MDEAGEKLKRAFTGAFALLFAVIVLCAVFCNQNVFGTQSPRSLLAGGLALAVGVLCAAWLLRLLPAPGKRLRRTLLAAFFTLCFLAQAHVGRALVVGATGDWDFGIVLRAALDFAADGAQGGIYFNNFPNNQPLMLLLAGLFRLLRACGVTEEYELLVWGMRFGAVLLQLALFFLYLCAARLLGRRAGALALLLSTDFFPWRILCSIRKPFSTFFMQIQFPWRFVGMAVPMLSAAAAWGYLREERDAKTGMAALIALCVVFSGYTMQTMVQRLPELEKETYTDTRIGQFEYTYPCTEKTALKVGDVRTSQPGVCNVLSYEKRGTELTATVQLEGEAAYIELPLLYYPGYRAEIDGQAQTVARGTNNMVRVYGLSSGESGTVHVWYQPPTAWLIAQGASALGALLLAASLRRMRRRA